MGYINDTYKDKIIEMSNAKMTNASIVEAIGIPLATVLYWKRKMREAGFITTDQTYSSGRPPATYHTCEKCGQKVKDKYIKKEIVKVPRPKVISQKEKDKLEMEELEAKLEKIYGKAPEK